MAANPVFLNEIKVKDIHLVVSKLLAPDEVRLGRLVTNIWSPSENSWDPDFDAATIADSTTRRNVQRVESIGNNTGTRRLSGVITKLLSARKLTTTKNRSRVQARDIEHMKLRNPETFLDIAIQQAGVQTWLNRGCVNGVAAFMITGYSIVRDLDIAATCDGDKTQLTTVNATAPINSTIDHMGLCLSGPLKLTLDEHKITETKGSAFCPGDSVWAVLYRKVKLRTSISTSCLSPTCKGWTVMLKPRGQIEQEMAIEPELETRAAADAEGKCGVMEDLEENEEEYELLFGKPGDDDVYLLPSLHSDDVADESCNESEQEA